MNSRRLFFKHFIGQIGVIRDDIRGVDKLPLKRLGELPDEKIEKIIPEFFTDEDWIKKDNLIVLKTTETNNIGNIELNPSEEFAYSLFGQGLRLIEISGRLSDQFNINTGDAYQTVKSLFLKLASERICHPRDTFSKDEFPGKKEQHGGI
jgi:hypothetical protein